MLQAKLIALLSPVLLVMEKGILFLLIALGLWELFIFVWRWRAIKANQGDAQKWLTALSSGFDKGFEGIEVKPEDLKTLPGRVVKTAIDNAGLSPEALEQVFATQESAERRAMEGGVSFLGTVGANAPFLGLTGTVIGILMAFNRFAESGGKGSTEVMVAISGALIATAIGLVVAIPAVVFFNVLKNQIKGALESAREIRGLLMARSLQAVAKER
jgi:biopolymer transport protein ExbB/TolQ